MIHNEIQQTIKLEVIRANSCDNCVTSKFQGFHWNQDHIDIVNQN